MRIVIMQPTYLPWLGYFELMANCEVFVFLDDVQFVKKTWQHRNRLKSKDGELLLTVPVLTKGKFKQIIKDVHINNELPWKRKHFNSITVNYRKAEFFDNYIHKLEEIYSKKYDSLLFLNLTLIDFLKKEIGVNTRYILSSQLNTTGTGSEKIVNICKWLNADTLYDAQGAKEILDLDVFKKNGIRLIFQEYAHPTYRQLHGEFISHLSALDLLFNEGDQSLEIILSGSPSGY